MRDLNQHLSDETLLLFTDGESHGREEAAVRAHLAACWRCRLRMRELEDAIADVTRLHQEGASSELPSAEGPRALLRARLRELAAGGPGRTRGPRVNHSLLGFGLAAAVLLGVVMWVGATSSERVAIPRSDLTPGAVRAVAATEVCVNRLGGNAEVVPAVQRQVFAEYGMANAERRAYEVDYLITPALGGSDDIRNLWPQPYAGSPWNAYVKDALEDRLREMVCAGQLDLATAQREIAGNWIAAYRKYFHTRRPLPEHVRGLDRGE